MSDRDRECVRGRLARALPRLLLLAGLSIAAAAATQLADQGQAVANDGGGTSRSSGTGLVGGLLDGATDAAGDLVEGIVKPSREPEPERNGPSDRPVTDLVDRVLDTVAPQRGPNPVTGTVGKATKAVDKATKAVDGLLTPGTRPTHRAPEDTPQIETVDDADEAPAQDTPGPASTLAVDAAPIVTPSAVAAPVPVAIRHGGDGALCGRDLDPDRVAAPVRVKVPAAQRFVPDAVHNAPWSPPGPGDEASAGASDGFASGLTLAGTAQRPGWHLVAVLRPADVNAEGRTLSPSPGPA